MRTFEKHEITSIRVIDTAVDEGAIIRALKKDPSRNEEDTVYVEAQSVVVGPLSSGHHGCTRHGGKQRLKESKWKCSEYNQHRR